MFSGYRNFCFFWEVFITSSPTLLPSESPITSTPTTSPSFIGLVVSVGITTTATGPLETSEVEYLEDLVADAYGVDSDDLTIVTEYVTSGTLDVTIPDNVSTEVAIADLTTAMSQALGMSEDSVTIEVDLETGEVTYFVSTDDYDATANIQDQLEDESLLETLNESTDVVLIDSVTPSVDIVADVTVVVDADEVTMPLQQAENRFDALLDNNYQAETEGTSHKFQQ